MQRKFFQDVIDFILKLARIFSQKLKNLNLVSILIVYLWANLREQLPRLDRNGLLVIYDVTLLELLVNLLVQILNFCVFSVHKNQDSQKPLETLFDSRVAETIGFVGRANYLGVLVVGSLFRVSAIFLIEVTALGIFERAHIIFALNLTVLRADSLVLVISCSLGSLCGLVIMSFVFRCEDTVSASVLVIFLLLSIFSL